MSRISNDIRKIFLKLKKEGKQHIEICKILGMSEQTTTAWSKLDEEELFKKPNMITRFPSIDLEELKRLNDQHPLATNQEIADLLGCGSKTVFKYRKKLGLKRKAVSKSYKEADEELKKTLQKK